MANYRPLQSSFTSGAFSPRLEGRVDIQRYANAVKTMQNFVALPYGGADRRPGTRYVAEVKTSAKKTRLLPFEYSDSDAYIIEVGDLYFRFYRNEAQIVSGTPVEVVTPYVEADLFEIAYAQSADVFYIVHKNYTVRKLTRTSHTAWTLAEVDFRDGPYLDERTDITITPSAASGNGITLTASAALFESGHVGAYFRLKHGSTWGYAKVTAVGSSTSATADVKSNFGATTASVAFREGAWSTKRGFPRAITFFEERLLFGGTKDNPQTFWGSKTNSFEDMTPGTTDDDPVSYTIGSDKVNVIRWMKGSRVLLIGTLGGEFRVRGASDAPMTPTNIDVRPETTYGSSTVPPVRVGNVVLFATRSGRKVRELTFNFDADAYVAPDLSILAEHLLRSTKSTDKKIVDMDFQQEEDPMLWAVRADGELLGMTYERNQDVVGWHEHITDGSFESVAVIPHPDGDREQVWVVVKRTINSATRRYIELFDDKDGYYNKVYVDSMLAYDGTQATTLTLSAVSGTSVTATAGSSVFAAGDVGKEIRAGTGRALITAFTSGTVVTVNVKNAFASTSIAASGWGIAPFTFTGLSHLEGKSVQLLGDGAVYPTATVSSGSVTVDISALKMEIGLKYTSTLETLRAEVQQQGGTAQGLLKRWIQVIVRVLESMGGKVGDRVLPTRSAADLMDAAPSLVSDDIELTATPGWDREGRIKIVQDQPLPMHVTSLTGTLAVSPR